jgi:putative DNA primase/helicase
MTRDVDRLIALRLAEARKAHVRGWLLTPLRGKKPYLKGWQAAPPPDLATVESWAKKGNIGVRTGAASGIVVLDDDTPDGSGLKALDLPPTPTMITGSGKRHAYFKVPAGGLRNSVKKLGGVDVRADGGQVVYAYSLHPETGRPYQWADGLSPDDVQIADLPAHVLEALRPPEAAQAAPEPEASPESKTALPEVPELLRPALQKYLKAVRKNNCTDLLRTPEGQRNHALNKAAFRLGRFVAGGLLDEQVVIADLTGGALACGLDATEIERTIKSGLDAGLKKPMALRDILDRLGRGGIVGDITGQSKTGIRPLTDTGNAERLVARFGQDLLYCHVWGKWLAWDGRRWQIDSAGRPMRLSKEIVRAIYAETKLTDDPGERALICEWAQTSEKLERRRALVTLAQCEDGIPILHDELDRDPWLLNLENGTLDLRTGVLGPHERAHRFTKLARIRLDPTSACPRWIAFLERVLPDAEVRAFVQRAVGWSLTGDVSAQVLFFCYGLGANGKSVFLRILLFLLGKDYAIQAAPELLLARRERGHPTDQADLFGVRLAVCVEMGPCRSFDEVMVKRLTGGDLIRARRMREDFWEFEPTHHLWIAANHKPGIKGTDYAIWRRILLIPFTVTIPEEERDRGLIDKLRQELPGIMNWAIDGCRQFLDSGLAPPEAVLLATKEYREEMDVLGGFIADCCANVDAPVRTAAGDLYKAYVAWCQSGGEEPITQRDFGIRMTERGFVRKTIRGKKFYQGLRLRQTEAQRQGDDVDEGRRTSGINAPREEKRPGAAEPRAPSGGTQESPRERVHTEFSSPSSTSSPQDEDVPEDGFETGVIA